MNEANDYFRANGIVISKLNVWAFNKKAIDFYKGLGFSVNMMSMIRHELR